ncbi:hypothetical protein [Demequina sp.]|uniref:DUF7507 domain-containing protein n=1 Tax=Demequina sp. TaxID=2050685 RepID=UPI0025B888AF|nr:hypothetical protein [Demequina sp.]
MSPTVARTSSFRRIAAAIVVTLIATMGITVASSPTASADTGPFSDDHISVTVSGMSISTDYSVVGRPDIGDIVSADVTVIAGDKDVSLAAILWDDSLVPYGLGTQIPAGESRTVTVYKLVTRDKLGHLGEGPFFDDISVSYGYRSGTNFLGWPTYSWTSLTVDSPPPFYAPGAPFTVATTIDITETGVVDGLVREGDTVGYTTTVTNTSGYVMVLDALPGYDDFTAPVTLDDGESATFHRTPVAVTYNDMVAGLVDFPDTQLEWSADFTVIPDLITIADLYTGTFPVPVGAATTETINTTFDSSVTYTVNTAAGANVPLGDAVAGDVIDFVVGATNTGNVTMNYVGIALDGSWGPAADAKSKNNSAFLAGTSLPNGTVKAKHLKSSGNGIFEPYTLTPTDVALGYVDLTTSVQVAPSQALFDGDPASYTHTASERVFLREFNTKAQLRFTKAQLNDTNGDGIGQEGETITYRVRFKNNADQSLLIDSAYDAAGSDIATPVGGHFTGKTRAPGNTIAKKWTHTITAADEARGSIDVGVTTDYTGQADWATNSRTKWAPTIATGPYVAPPTTLDTSATYVDGNGDGFPSIGETVTVTVTAANIGTYPLTGLVVTDAAGSDVTGLLPAFSGTIAAGSSETQTFTYVLTAPDFARGSLAYSTEMTADGMATTASSTSVNLTDITFQAYASDLLTMAEGGISVCLPDLTPTSTVVIGNSVTVTPGASCVFGGAPDDYRVVGFSTPMVLGTHTFSVVVPGAMGVGAHSLGLYGPDGELVGWKAVTVKDPIAFSGRGRTDGGALAYTGLNEDGIAVLAGGAAALVLLGTASMVVGLRPRRTGTTPAL